MEPFTNPFDPKPMPRNPLRLAQRRPRFEGRAHGGDDRIAYGIERALKIAHERARESGQRQVVTCSPYVQSAMRVQAWR